jgi:8-hydroxy-5-deazaflavin:NADPH oxidoreductase
MSAVTVPTEDRVAADVNPNGQAPLLGSRSSMKIGVVGAGNIGGALARHLVRLGHDVVVANSRGPETLAAFAAESGATPVSVAEALREREVVVITIPQKAVPALPTALFAKLPASVAVVDTGNYYPELRDGRISELDEGTLDSEWVAKQIGRPVVKAFNNIYAASLDRKGTPKGTPGRIALSVAGDSVPAKATTMHLIDELGFDPVDAGALKESWRQQPGAPAYCNDLDAARLKQALAEADRSRVNEYRVEAENMARRFLASAKPVNAPFSGRDLQGTKGSSASRQAGNPPAPQGCLTLELKGTRAGRSRFRRSPERSGCHGAGPTARPSFCFRPWRSGSP